MSVLILGLVGEYGKIHPVQYTPVLNYTFISLGNK